MECWARILGKDYPIADGFTISDELSESLDSGSIILPHVSEVLSLKPYDDVIIHDFDPNGPTRLPTMPYGQSTSEYVRQNMPNRMYRHLVVRDYTREELEIGSGIFNYKIELQSETSKLETVQLPNRTLSQPRGTIGDSNNVIPSSGAVTKFPSFPYSSPLGVYSDWRQSLVMNEETISPVEMNKYYMYVGDNDQDTADFMSYTTIKSVIQQGLFFTLPDLNISSITVLKMTKTFIEIWYRIHSYEVMPSPKKHWIIVDITNDNVPWINDRARAIEIITDCVDNGNYSSYPEIVNSSFIRKDGYGHNDISSRDQIAVEVGKLNIVGDFRVFLYIERYVHNFGSYQANIFGMTNNENGKQRPGEDDEFLAYWDFSISNTTLDYVSKDVMTVYEAVREAISLYSPYIRITRNGTTWEYIRKFSLDKTVKEHFDSVVAPENQWNLPNLKDYITRLFYSRDCIPVVKDNIIYYKDLSERKHPDFDTTSGSFGKPVYSMSASSYCDRLLRVYNDGLSKDSITKCVERVGFKNSNAALLTIENLQLELDHPIYKIEKVYMCFYNKLVDNNGKNYMALSKHDITPLVLLNAQRNLLSEDWNSLESVLAKPSSIEELAKFKYATIGYDIGSNKITGFGTKYSHPTCMFFDWSTTKTTLENIFTFVYGKSTFGINKGQLASDRNVYKNLYSQDELITNTDNDVQAGFDANEEPNIIHIDQLSQNNVFSLFFSNLTNKLKSLMFIVEYEGYISSSVLASKEFHDGDVVSRDNASSSLSFVESDGVNQKEKANRLGNATVMVPARHTEYSKIQPISCAWNSNDGVHSDEILYQRTVAHYKDHFQVTYQLCKNYVLRNYFTSVYSKHRPFPLASYEESVDRQENKSLQLLLSADAYYYQAESKHLVFNDDDYLYLLVSFFTENEIDSSGNVVNDFTTQSYYGVYPSIFNKYKGQCGFFASDSQKFVSGNSLCFTVTMKDNASAGVYVANFNTNAGEFVWDNISRAHALAYGWDISPTELDSTSLLTGSSQDWFMFPQDENTGMLYEMSFGVGYMESKDDIYGVNKLTPYSFYDICSAQMLPLLDVVFEKIDGNSMYFGKKKENSEGVIGLGYPRIEFQIKDYGESWYGNEPKNWLAKIVRPDIPYRKQDWIVENPTKFYDIYGNDVGQRQKMRELLTAKFYGSETESAEENGIVTDTCVFKDGKERITTTIQIEPICEDMRIRLSSYFMKLSDLVGEKVKKFNKEIVVDKITAAFGVTNILTNGNHGGYSVLKENGWIYSLPCTCIGIPLSKLEALEEPVHDISVDFTFTIHDRTETDPENDPKPIYVIHITKIKGLQNNNQELVCEGQITFYARQHNVMIEGGSVIGTESGDLLILSDGPRTYASGDLIFRRANGDGTPIKAFSSSNLHPGDYEEEMVLYGGADGVASFIFVDETNLYYSGNVNEFHNPGDFLPVSYLSKTVYDMKLEYYTEDGVTMYAFANPSFLWSDTLYFDRTYSLLRYVWKQQNDSFDDVAFKNVIYKPYGLNIKNYIWLSDYNNNHELVEGSASITMTRKLDAYAIDVYGFSEGIAYVDGNIFWVFSSDYVNASSPYEKLNSLDSMQKILDSTQIDVFIANIYNKNALRIAIDPTLHGSGLNENGGSYRMYYLENGYYHFVFGFNCGAVNGSGNSNLIYATRSGGKDVYTIYMSFMDTRSKSVIDDIQGSPTRGEATYTIKNFANTNETPSNSCIPKG